MSDSRIDYVNPYSKLAQQYQDGLDAIITDIGTGGPGTVTVDQLIESVMHYVQALFDIDHTADGDAGVRALVANAINGYLDNGGSSPFLKVLQAIPPVALGNQFDRLFDASRAARVLRGNAGRQQLTIALGQADAQYWAAQIATTGSWVAYMSGNEAIDTASVPYWTDAAMFGAQFDYYQVNGTDSKAVSMVYASAIAGALAVSAGKMVFGWVPNKKQPDTKIITEVARTIVANGGKIPFGVPAPVNPPALITYEFCCDNGVQSSFQADSDAQADAIVGVISGLMGSQFSLSADSDL